MAFGQLMLDGDNDHPYVTPVFPGSLFNMRDQNGDEDGPFDPEDFTHDEDNVWFAQTEGRPIILRVIKQEGSRIWCVDGDGTGWQYDMIPVGAPLGV